METFTSTKEIISRYPGLAALGLVLFVVGTSLLSKSRGPWKKLPPGPRGIPILGNLVQLMGDKWITFTALKKKYGAPLKMKLMNPSANLLAGPIMYLNAAGQPIIILNTLKVASDLLDRKAAVTSHRPTNIVVGTMTGDLLITFLNPGDVWHRMRRASHRTLRPEIAHLFQPGQYREALILSIRMLTESTNMGWHGHIQRAVAASTIKLVYGKTAVDSETDKDVKTLNKYVERLTRSATAPSTQLVNHFPWLDYIPSWLAPWKSCARKAFGVDSATFKGLYDETRSMMKRGIDRPSVVNMMAESSKGLGLSVDEEYWLAGAVFTGAQTVPGVISWWLLAMILYPDVQKRAQDELDRVVGRSRLPTFEDFDSMPYMQAIVKEVNRWRPIDPLGLPHTASEDIWYDGYFIPKGAMLVPNVWAINRDPDTFGSDAHHFNPARHLDEATGKAKSAPADTKDEGHVSYGFGRRICVGRHFANKMLLTNIALLTWSINIDCKREPDGRPVGLVDVDGCIDEGVIVRPIPFPCNFKPRFPEALSVLQQALTELSVQDI